MSVGVHQRPPPPTSRPPPPPTIGEEGSDISSSDYRERLRSKSRGRSIRGSSTSDSRIKNDPIESSTTNASDSDSSKPMTTVNTSESGIEKKVRKNKVKLLQPPDGLTLMDLDNDLLKRRFKNKAEKFYSPVVLLTEGLYITSSTKFSLVEDKAREVGLVVHINIREDNDPDTDLNQCGRLNYDLDSSKPDVDTICSQIHKNSIKASPESSRRATLIRYDSKTSEDTVAVICGAYLIKFCDQTVHQAYATLKSKLLSSKKDTLNSSVYLKLVEIHESFTETSLAGTKFLKGFLKKNLVSFTLNWIPLFIIGLLFVLYFRGALKFVSSLFDQLF